MILNEVCMNNNRQPNSGRPHIPPQGQPQNRQAQNRPAQPMQNNSNVNPGMNRIKDQTPTQRRTVKSEVKLTPEQIEINRVNRQRERYYIKKRRKASFKTFLARFLLFLVIFALMLAIAGGVFMRVLTSAPEDKSSSYSYSIGDSQYSLPSSKAVRDGRVYVSFSDIAEMCDLAVTGSNDDMKYVIKGDEAETIRFVTDSRVVYVNGVETRLGANCYFENKELYVPVEFVGAYLSGINVEVDEGRHTVTVERIITNLGENGKLPKGEEPIYAELSFLLQSTVGLEPLDEEAEMLAELPDFGFVSNLAAYEEYMNPGNTDEFLTLVNINNKLGADHIPQDLASLVDTRQDGRETQMMRKNAAMSLEAMFKELRAAGYEDVSVTSAYRSYSYQEYLFNMYLAQNNNDYEKVASFSNPPGSSEHQTGLCADLHNLPSATKAFADEPAYDWLRENCWKFGFILRYPEDKTEITGISFEPWHYRYVGRYHAQKMHESNMCLEEYLEYISPGN